MFTLQTQPGLVCVYEVKRLTCPWTRPELEVPRFDRETEAAAGAAALSGDNQEQSRGRRIQQEQSRSGAGAEQE